MKKSAIIIGAGIVGLATARALAQKGYFVTVVEKNESATGASIRNFGMIWPVGQCGGKMYERAVRSRDIWKGIAGKTGFWYDPCGSLHLAYHEDEWTVLQELNEVFQSNGRLVNLMSPSEIKRRFNGINQRNLLGGLFSRMEMIIDPREAMMVLPTYLSEKYNVQFIWNETVTDIENRTVKFGNKSLKSDIIFICSGMDFETLYPETFASLKLTKCKLQMMRFKSTDPKFKIGTSLCSGLSLLHYNSYQVASSLPSVKKRFDEELPEYLRLGIHVMVSQNGTGELTVGNSQEYGSAFTPFNEANINELITSYLKTFAVTDNWKLIQSWYSIYPERTDDRSYLFHDMANGVYIINGLGEASMTLSFGLAEEIANSLR